MDLIRLARTRYGTKLIIRSGRIGRRKGAEIHFTLRGRVVCCVGEAYALVTDLPQEQVFTFLQDAKTVLEKHGHPTRLFCTI